MSVEEIRGQHERPTLIEFADGLWTPGEPVKVKPSEIVRRATRSVSVVLSKLRKAKRSEMPLTQEEIDAPYTANVKRMNRRRRLRFVAASRLEIDDRVGFER